MIRILIADDHPIVRTGLSALFSAEPDLEVVGEAATAEDAVQRSSAGGVDLVLLDLQFGNGQFGDGMHGVAATRALLALGHPPRVLILTNYDTDADILGAIEAGASGYLLKDAPPAELLAAVRAASAGHSALAPAVAARLDTRRNSSAPELSPREIEVLDLVGRGLTNRQIGADLFLSEATVKSHLVHIFTKLGVSSRTQAVARARASGQIRA